MDDASAGCACGFTGTGAGGAVTLAALSGVVFATGVVSGGIAGFGIATFDDAVEVECEPPLGDTGDSGLTFSSGLRDPDVAECSNPGFLVEVGFTAGAPPAESSSLSSVFGSAADVLVAPVAGFGVLGPAEAVPDVLVEVLFDGESAAVEVSDAGAAHATPGIAVIADPIPSATAKAPTRPTCIE